MPGNQKLLLLFLIFFLYYPFFIYIYMVHKFAVRFWKSVIVDTKPDLELFSNFRPLVMSGQW